MQMLAFAQLPMLIKTYAILLVLPVVGDAAPGNKRFSGLLHYDQATDSECSLSRAVSVPKPKPNLFSHISRARLVQLQ